MNNRKLLCLYRKLKNLEYGEHVTFIPFSWYYHIKSDAAKRLIDTDEQNQSLNLRFNDLFSDEEIEKFKQSMQGFQIETCNKEIAHFQRTESVDNETMVFKFHKDESTGKDALSVDMRVSLWLREKLICNAKPELAQKKIFFKNPENNLKSLGRMRFAKVLRAYTSCFQADIMEYLQFLCDEGEILKSDWVEIFSSQYQNKELHFYVFSR